MARLSILCGLPGSGKTTTALAMAAHGAVRMCPDGWMRALGVDLWDEEARARIEALQWSLTQDVLCAGSDVVIEWGTWARAERDALRIWCREHGVAVSLLHLDVALDELVRRLDERNPLDGEVHITHAQLDDWYRTVWQPPSPEELRLFDPLPEGAS